MIEEPVLISALPSTAASTEPHDSRDDLIAASTAWPGQLYPGPDYQLRSQRSRGGWSLRSPETLPAKSAHPAAVSPGCLSSPGMASPQRVCRSRTPHTAHRQISWRILSLNSHLPPGEDLRQEEYSICITSRSKTISAANIRPSLSPR